jgi:hypothetical protein
MLDFLVVNFSINSIILDKESKLATELRTTSASESE